MLAFGCAWLVGPAFGKDAERAFAFPGLVAALEGMKGRKNMSNPMHNELSQFSYDLFGSTALNSDMLAPIGLIRIPMKENSDENESAADSDHSLPTQKKSSATALNFRLDGSRNLAPNWKGRGQDNLAAIRLLHQLETEGRAATKDEQAALIKFCAFSSTDLAQNAFKRGSEAPKKGFEGLAAELEALVSAEEKAGLMRATQYAHYTPEYLINAMWRTVERFGFEGGSIIEPGCGTGLFLAASPADIAGQSYFTGIEADPITARIAGQLYPESDIRQGDFTKTKLTPIYDLAIGNPPFSDRTVRFNEVKPATQLSLHDYFIAKSIFNLRPGGIAAFIVSRWTMDKVDPTARLLISEKANLIGAIRLPAASMRQDAGTDVVVDMLYFQRRADGEPANGSAWMNVAESVPATDESEAFYCNQYFGNNPAMVLGKHDRTTSPYGLVYTCTGDTGEGREAALDAALQTLPSAIHTPDRSAMRRAGETSARVFAGSVAQGGTVREGSYLVTNHRLHQIIDGRPVEIAVKRGKAKGEGVTLRTAEIIECMIPIRDAVRQILRAQEANRPYADAQVALRRAHSRFLRNFGPINKTDVTIITDETTGRTKEVVRRPNLAPFADDPDVWLVASIEDYDAERNQAKHGAIFSQRVILPPASPQIVTAADALTVSLHDTGKVDLDYIVECLGSTQELVIAELRKMIFLNPVSNEWETADAYLSGPVRTKLKDALAAAQSDPRFEYNVEALKEAQPTDLKPSEITARLGASWIPTDVIAGFCAATFEVKTGVRYVSLIGLWTLDQNRFSTSLCSTEWGTERRHTGELMHDALNSAIPQIFDVFRNEDGSESRILNAEATEAAKEKLAKIKLAFQNWVWTDADRAERLSTIYNEVMNNLVPRHFDGSHLTLPGASAVINFHRHQKRAIWRIISAGSTYIAHAVGAGKTFSMAAAIMEQKRLGLITKGMMVVPGHCLAQASREFLLLYPTAKIMVADETNFAKDKRQRFIARAALGDWDCIIITHSAFKFISIPSDFEREMVQAQMEEFEAMLGEVDDAVSRKKIERLKEGFEAKLSSMESRKDDLLTISEMGVDQIIVDEAQEFRKLAFATNQSTLKGIDPNGSQRAWDLFVKTRYIESINAGRSLVMASGTPITNTMGELYTLQRFFVPEILERAGVQHFDAWAGNFGDSRTELELQPSGSYKPVTRFSEFVNVPELVDIFRSFADVVLQGDLRDTLNLPRIATGKRQMITSKPTAAFKAYQRHLDGRIKAIESRTGRPCKGDDILLSVITDGRHAAVDLRLVASGLPDDAQSKLNALIANALKIYQETADRIYHVAPGVPYEQPGGGQLIFSDIGTNGVEMKRGFSAYRWIKSQLVERGVPDSEIAFMQDYKKTSEKQRLFAAFNAGQVRFIIGSTLTMGTGVNVQKRLVALHHLDVPWLPSDISQREGRIERQGNQNEEVGIFAYATLTSMDATMWQNNERKQRFIEASLSGDRAVRRLEDVGAQSNQFAMAKAISSGDQRLMQKAGIEAELARLERLDDSHGDNQISIRRTINYARGNIETGEGRIKHITADLAKRIPTAADQFAMTVNGVKYTERKQAGSNLIRLILEGGWDTKKPIFGEVGGFTFKIAVIVNNLYKIEATEAIIYRSKNEERIALPDDLTALGVVARLENALTKFEVELEEAEQRVTDAQRRIADFEPRLGQPFDMQDELDAKRQQLDELEASLAASSEAETVVSDEELHFAEIFHASRFRDMGNDFEEPSQLDADDEDVD